MICQAREPWSRPPKRSLEDQEASTGYRDLEGIRELGWREPKEARELGGETSDVRKRRKARELERTEDSKERSEARELGKKEPDEARELGGSTQDNDSNNMLSLECEDVSENAIVIPHDMPNVECGEVSDMLMRFFEKRGPALGRPAQLQIEEHSGSFFYHQQIIIIFK